MTRKKDKLVLYLLVISLLFTSVSFASIDAEIDKSKRRKQEFNRKVAEKRAEIIQNQSKLTKTEREYYSLNKEIVQIDGKIEDLKDKITAKEASIKFKEREVELAGMGVDNQKQKLKIRLRAMYRLQKSGYLEILLKADSLRNVLTRVEQIRSILDYDKKLLKKLKDAKNKLQIIKAELVKEKADLIVLKDQELKERDKFQRALARVEVIKKTLQVKKASLEREEKLFRAEIDEITRYIKKLEIKKKYAGGKMRWPLDYKWHRITSYFGRRRAPTPGATTNHGAIDVAVPSGQPVYAAQRGTVVISRYMGSYGQFILIDHGGGIMTAYAHNSRRLVRVGQEVKKGQKISLSGSTGRSTGPHLHFEVRVKGTRVDPLKYVAVPR